MYFSYTSDAVIGFKKTEVSFEFCKSKLQVIHNSSKLGLSKQFNAKKSNYLEQIDHEYEDGRSNS